MYDDKIGSFWSIYIGIILPGDTEKIEVKFRSHVPGSFSESWLLGTVPLLAAGGQIKFILKGWARVKKDYSEECRRIQVCSW